MKRKLGNILIGMIFVLGIACLLYPSVSDWWNRLHQSYAVASYMEMVDQESADYTGLKEAAEEYNSKLVNDLNRWTFTDKESAEYERLLSATENGILGCIEIPQIDVSLPIYHGTEESVLQIAVGHMKGSSLPIGGEDTHSVLSAHTGLPSAKLFTDIDQLEVGDYFMLRILDETLTYEVDRIAVVEPKEMEYLAIEEGKDYCTLLTCTPYGINTHRLLVRGHRVENRKELVEAMEDRSGEMFGNLIKIGILVVAAATTIIVVVVVRKRRNAK